MQPLSYMESLLLRIPVILLALTVHEYAHGWVAWLRGDATARRQGRLTFNPLAHIDPIGALMLLWGPFGWARPVPVSLYHLRNPRNDIRLVSLAGPVSNILLGGLFALIFRLLFLNGVMDVQANRYLVSFFVMAISINFGLAFFNLLPIPPLDGSKILAASLPSDAAIRYEGMAGTMQKVFFGLIIAEWLFKVPLFSALLNPLWKPYFNLMQTIFLGKQVF